MDNRNTKNEEIEIDLARLFAALVKRSWMIAIVAVICAVATLLGTVLFVAPKYQSSAMFYVNNSSLLGDVTIGGITSSDISASKSLVKTYIVILNTRETLNDVIDYAGVDLTYSKVKNMISAEAVDSTEVFRVTVTSTDPEEAEKIADAIAYILPKRIANIIKGSSAAVVDSAVMPSSASSPNYTRNTMMGFLIGLLAISAAIVIRELLDNTIRSEEDVTQNCMHPILAPVPDLAATSKGAGYGYGQKGKEDGTEAEKRTVPLVGKGIGFAAQESYKLLRTKLQFSFADDNACHVIGISSALPGEGKSLTAINLAYSLSELGKRVILLDADMRRPTLAEKLNINKKPGLSSYLTGQSDLNNLVQYCGIAGDEQAFHVITAGQNPPNPIELLSSNRMDVAIETLRKHYDYVIFDLPPIVEVSDTLAVAQKLDGVLMVVRQNHCNRLALNMTLRQLAFVDAKVLGVVFNAVTDEGRSYGRKYYRYYKSRYGRYNRYYSRYYTRYSRHYGHYYSRDQKNGSNDTQKDAKQ